MLDFLCDVERFDGHLLGMPINQFLLEIPRLPNTSFDLEQLFRDLPPEATDLPVFELLEALHQDEREVQESWARERHEQEERERHEREDDQRRSDHAEPQIPGWLNFISKVAQNMSAARREEEAAACRRQYQAGFEAARQGRMRRIRLIAEPSEFFDAWNAGYDAGSE